MISQEEGSEHWVSFKYKRLPNICYWYACLNHNDIDYDLWIKSNGTLSSENKEYRPWICAPSNPMFRKNVVIVPGYYEARKKEKKGKSSARSWGGTSCPPPDGGTSSAHGGALSSYFSQVTNMVIAVEKGNILHISHTENIC